MLSKSFSVAAVVALTGSVVWMGCSSDDSPAATNTTDAGSNTENDAGSDPVDSGNDQGKKDSGTTNDAGTFEGVDITYGKCPAVAKCGGDIVGSWKVSGGCVPDDAFAEAKAQCPGLQESDVVIKANGTVVATATTVERKTNVQVSAKVVVPKACSPVPDCGLIAAGLQTGALPGAPKFEKATCTDGGDNCNCDVLGTASEESNDDYTTNGGVLTTTNPDRTFDYCVDGNKTTYTETTPVGQGEFRLPVIVEITK